MTTLLALWIALVGGEPARAPVHAALVSSAPAADSVVRTPVREIRLVFSEAIDPGISTITLTGPAGPVTTGAAEGVPGRMLELVLPLATALPSGAYTVTWRVASDDGHPVIGTFRFTVDAPLALDSPRAAPPAPAGPPGPAVSELPGFIPGMVAWLLYFTTTGILGLAAFRWGVLEPLRAERSFALLAFPALRRAWGLGWAFLALAVVLPPLRLGVQAIQLFGDEAVARGADVMGSTWGLGWRVEVLSVLLLAAGLGIAGAQGRRVGWVLVGASAVLASLVPALSGHSAAAQQLGPLLIVNDALHVAGAGAWIGGLALVLLVGLPAAREADIPRELGGGVTMSAALVGRFSRIALVCVGVMLATGVVNAWVQVGSWSNLVATAYGRTLLIKLALIVPTAALGLHHWRRVRPRIEADGDTERLQSSAFSEVGLALIVLGVTAVLALTPPPRSERAHPPEPPSAAGAQR